MTAPLGAALDSDHPLATANYVSLLMGLLRDGRLYDPVADKPFRNLAHFVDHVMDTEGRDATALLHCIAAMTSDTALAQYIRHELASRSHEDFPPTVTRLAELRITEAWMKPDPDGVGEQWVLELAGAGIRDHVLSLYVDHRFADALKFAAIVEQSAQHMMSDLFIPAAASTDFEQVPLDEAGAKCRHALAQYVVYQDEMKPLPNWPGQRDLVEMLLRSLPEGGQGYPERVRAPQENGLTLDEDVEDQVIREWVVEYYLSRNLPSVEALDAEEIFILEALITAALHYLDAYRPCWEPRIVQWLMTWFLPMVLDPETGPYDRGPAVLREFIRFWHAHHGIDYGTTLSALTVLKRHEPEYAALRHDPIIARRRSAAAKAGKGRD
ncbi:hypothetical protein [Nostocoides veronense]|uniref:hypothetical protein n=1 Tax=Nostocoides veronense TaxID=330836 RepID=UPI0031CF6718